MKRYSFLILLLSALFLIPNGCRIGNDPPYTPSNPSPSDEATDQPTSLTLSWKGGDPDGDEVTYDLYFGTSPSPPLKASNLTSTSYSISGLSNNTTYYWKIIAEDENGATAEGPVWHFETSGYVDYCDPNKQTSPDGEILWLSGKRYMSVDSYDLPFSISPGQKVTTRITYSRYEYDPGDIVYVNVFGNWIPNRELARLESGVLGSDIRDRSPVTKSFTFTAPSEPGSYSIRWMATDSYYPIHSYYGGKDDDPTASPHQWVQIDFRVQ